MKMVEFTCINVSVNKKYCENEILSLKSKLPKNKYTSDYTE